YATFSFWDLYAPLTWDGGDPVERQPICRCVASRRTRQESSRGTPTEAQTTMRIPTWRLALTGGAILILAIAGIGVAAAAVTSGTQQAATVDAAPAADTGA